MSNGRGDERERRETRGPKNSRIAPPASVLVYMFRIVSGQNIKRWKQKGHACLYTCTCYCVYRPQGRDPPVDAGLEHTRHGRGEQRLPTLSKRTSSDTSHMTRAPSWSHFSLSPRPPGCTYHFRPSTVEFCSKTPMVGWMRDSGQRQSWGEESHGCTVSQRRSLGVFVKANEQYVTTVVHYCNVLHSAVMFQI